MKIGELNKHFPVMDGLIEVKASTKKQQGYIKVLVPDELINHLMKASCGIEVPISHLVIAYYDKTIDDGKE